MANQTAFALGAVVWIDAKGGAGGKVLDMRTRHGALEYLIEHPEQLQPVANAPGHGVAEWIAAKRLQLAEGMRLP